MKTLGKEAEKKLIEAVKTAVSLVDDDGMKPDKAMEKVAKQEKFSQEMIRFAAAAYNTGRQTAQRENNDNLLSKMADFPLVDPDKVIAGVWPSKAKTPAEKSAESVSSEYGFSPAFLYERDRKAAVKAAADTAWYTDSKPEPLQPDPGVKMARDIMRKDDLRKEAEAARTRASISHDKLVSGMHKLAAYFRQFPMDRIPFARADFSASAYHGDAGRSLMDWTYDRCGLKEARANDTKNYTSTSIDPSKEPYSLIAECVKLAKEVGEARLEHQQAKEAFDKQAEVLRRPFVREEPKAWSPLLIEKEALDPATLAANQMLGGKSNEDMLEDTWLDLEDPLHDQELDRIRAQALLAEMMDDEVIGGYGPDEVANAYNEVSQLAPRAAKQPAVMRSILRRQLQGNVEPFEAGEIAGLEKTLKDTTTQATPDTKLLSNAPKSILG